MKQLCCCFCQPILSKTFFLVFKTIFQVIKKKEILSVSLAELSVIFTDSIELWKIILSSSCCYTQSDENVEEILVQWIFKKVSFIKCSEPRALLTFYFSSSTLFSINPTLHFIEKLDFRKGLSFTSILCLSAERVSFFTLSHRATTSCLNKQSIFSGNARCLGI